MKTIAIFFQKEGKLAPPFDAEIFFEAYKHIAFLLQEKNIRTVFSRGTNSYLKAGKFSSGYEFIGDELQEVSEFTADMVYDKGDQEGFLEVYDEKVLSILENTVQKRITFLLKKSLELGSTLLMLRKIWL
jgi:hypothetical protein